MRSALIAASSLLALSSVTLTPAAVAQVRACEQHNNQTTGTVVGAIGGALLGNAVAGHGDKKTGAIIGAIGGAIIGNQIGKSKTADCNHAYGFYDTDGRWHTNPVNRDVAAGYYDRNGRWSDGAPNGYYDRNGAWVSATADMRQGYYDNSGRWVPPQVDGYYDPDNRWVAVSAPPPQRYANNGRYAENGRYADNGDYWRDAPRDARARTQWLRERIQRAEYDRRISHREASNLLDDLRDIEVREARMPHRNGGLNYRDEQVIQAQLDDLNRDFRQEMRG